MRLKDWGLIAALLMATVAGAVTAPTEAGQRIQGARKDLKQLAKEIKKGKQVVSRHARQEKTIMQQLEQSGRDLDSARRESLVHARNLGVVEDRLMRVRSRLDLLQAEEASDRDVLRAGLIRLYHARVSQGPALLFSAQTPAEFGARAHYLSSLNNSVQRRVKSLRDRIAQVEGYRREFRDREVELKKRQSDVQAARAKVEQERVRRQALMHDVRNRKAEAQQEVVSLERSAQGLQDLVDGLQKEVRRLAEQRRKQNQVLLGNRKKRANAHIEMDDGPSTLRGRLPWPTLGRIVSRFGKQRHPIFNTTVFNRGIEIAAPYGSAVRAVASGTVLHAAQMEGFGQLVVLDHGGNMMSVYGYASEVHVTAGQSVVKGDLLAGVGEAGTAKQPALYFEIRQGAKAQDPLRYLGRR